MKKITKEVSMTIKLSPTALKLFAECPRCFYLNKNMKVVRGNAPFPGITGGIDEVNKHYFDKYRINQSFKGKIPPELLEAEGFEGDLFGRNPEELEKLNIWRNWRKEGLTYQDKDLDVILTGAIDDLVVSKYGIFVPWDNKSRGSAPTDDTTEYNVPQLDSYCLMLDDSGYPTDGFAYLHYVWPTQQKENGIFMFDHKIERVKTSHDRIKEIIKKAVKCLRSNDIPEPDPKCTHCKFVAKYNAIFASETKNT